MPCNIVAFLRLKDFPAMLGYTTFKSLGNRKLQTEVSTVFDTNKHWITAELLMTVNYHRPPSTRCPKKISDV